MESVIALMPFINVLRPTKSPYLLIFLVSIVLMNLFLMYGLNYSVQSSMVAGWLFHIPIYILLAGVLILSFFYTPPELSAAAEITNKGDGKSQKEIDSEIFMEIDHQLKFSRAVCLVAGVISLYLFAINFDLKLGVYTVITYVIIMFHLLVFLSYMAFRSMKEEGLKRFSIHQIGLITGIVLIGLSLSYGKIGLVSYEQIYSEEVDTFVEPNSITGDPDKNDNIVVGGEDSIIEDIPTDVVVKYWARNNWYYFIFIWGTYMIFWVGRLRHFVRINIVDPE